MYYNRAVSKQLFDSWEKKIAKETYHVIRISQTGEDVSSLPSWMCLFFQNAFEKVRDFPAGRYILFYIYILILRTFFLYRTAEEQRTNSPGSADSCDLLSEWKLFLRPCCTYVAAPTLVSDVFQRILGSPLE